MASIGIDRITKVYDNGFLAVDDVSLEIRDGEFMVLVGPSGCGKSTLLRMIAGLEEVTAGAVRIGGSDVTELAPRHRDIAMVFQSYALYPHMTVRDNLGYGLKVRKAPKPEIRRRVDEVADLLGLTEMLDRKPLQLSGGQRQRVAMGRAIVREPQAFLMDEPLSNLDAKLRVGMRASLAQLHAKLGVTTVYVTHDQTEAMTLGQRVAVMRDGKIVQVAEPQTLYSQPDEPLRRGVHRLAGDEPRRGLDRGRRARLRRPPRAPRRTVAAPSPRSTASSSGSGPRPSRTPSSHRADLPRLTVHVEVVEELGADTHAFFRVDAPRISTDVRAARRRRRRSSQASERCSRRVSIRARGSGRPGTRRSRSTPDASISSIPATAPALRLRGAEAAVVATA